MKSVLVIGDIAGQMDALERLVALVPEDTVKISVGDMVDRGPRSKEVLEYFMDGYGVSKLAVLGNHEHMMLSQLTGRRMYDYSTWDRNGGWATMESFPDQEVPEEILTWIEALPISLEIQGPEDKLFISHAPWLAKFHLDKAEFNDFEIFDLIWNRCEPVYHPGYLQIFGHNSHWGLESFKVLAVEYAKCIDASREKVLTGFLYPEKQILQVPYEVAPVKVPEDETEDF